MIAVPFHENKTRLNIPVAAKFFPAHLDIDAHHQIWFVRRLASSFHTFTPFPFERHATQHSSFTRPHRRTPNSLLVRGRIPQAGVQRAQPFAGGSGVSPENFSPSF